MNNNLSKKESDEIHRNAEKFALTVEKEELEIELSQCDYSDEKRKEIIIRISSIEAQLNPTRIKGTKEKIS